MITGDMFLFLFCFEMGDTVAERKDVDNEKGGNS